MATTTRIYKGKTYQSHLLRRTFRVGFQVKHETLGNISHLPPHLIDLVRRSLAGEEFLPARSAFQIDRSLPHGHVQAVLGSIRRLGLEALLASKPAASATEDDLYQALDWLLARQAQVEKRLAQRHLNSGAIVLYDVSSSSYEGHSCPLARLGHNRDGKKGLPIIVYGLLTDGEGRPVAIDVYPGNTGDPTTVPDQVEKLRQRDTRWNFGIMRPVARARAPLPEGFVYLPNFLSAEEERTLLEAIGRVDFGEVRMRGVTARRRVAHFGWLYGYESAKVAPGPPVPQWLRDVRVRLAALAGVESDELAEALITEYPSGAGIGWHRDAPPFGIVAAVSLAGACRMRFRRGEPGNRETAELNVQPRSAYVIAGEARAGWKHGIPPGPELRYSITFRTLRKRPLSIRG